MDKRKFTVSYVEDCLKETIVFSGFLCSKINSNTIELDGEQIPFDGEILDIKGTPTNFSLYVFYSDNPDVGIPVETCMAKTLNEAHRRFIKKICSLFTGANKLDHVSIALTATEQELQRIVN